MSLPKRIFSSFLLLTFLSFALQTSTASADINIKEFGTSIGAALGASAAASAAQTAESVVSVPVAATPSASTQIKAARDGVLKRLGIAIARTLVQSMVNDTVKWINGGSTKQPRYVTNPGNYLANVVNGATGDFINSSELGFLCSPFKASVQIALHPQATHQQIYQCTVTQIGVNLENFYKDFAEGGWNGWFAITQNDTSNPYGAYVTAKAELDSRVSNALGLANQQITINDGFLSTTDCLVHNPDQATLDQINKNIEAGSSIGAEEDAYGIKFNLDKTAGACIEEGGVVTPGKTISEQLNKDLHTGTDQIVSANDIDSLLNAVLTHLLSRTIYSAAGLFNANPYQSDDKPDLSSTVSIPTTACSPNVESTLVGSPVIWKVETTLDGTVTTVWHSGDSLAATTPIDGTSASVVYSTTGIKDENVDVFKNGNLITNYTCKPLVTISNISCSASATNVKVGTSVLWTANRGTYPAQLYKWSGDNIPASAQTPTNTNTTFVTTYAAPGTYHAVAYFYPSTAPNTAPVSVNCTNPVTVTTYDPLTVACAPSVSTAPVSDATHTNDVHWTATVKGGSGRFQLIQFIGNEEQTALPTGVTPGTANLNIWPTPSSSTLTTVNSNVAAQRDPTNPNKPPWSLGPLPWTYSDLINNVSHSSTVLFGGTVDALTIDVARAYFVASSTPHTASLHVVDADNGVQQVTQACGGSVTIHP